MPRIRSKAVRLSYFIVIFLGLIAVSLILIPLVWRLSRDNNELGLSIYAMQQDVASTIQRSEHYRLASEHASDGLILQDMQGRIIWCNKAYCKMHATTPEAIIGRNPLEFVLPPDRALSLEEINKISFDIDIKSDKLRLFQNQDSHGNLFWIQLSVSFHESANGRNVAVAVCRDVSQQVAKEAKLLEVTQELEHEATHDGLTAVANRAAFLTFMENIMEDPARRNVGLLHIDLDNFKAVNDTHGHSAGDAVLVHSAKALRETIADVDLVARVGGDEFVVVCPDTSDLVSLDALAADLLNVLSAPFEWSGRILQCEASIGASFSDGTVKSAEDLLLKADFALYEAKRSGRNQVRLYDEDLHDRHTVEMRHAVELADAIDVGALDYYFQPTMDLATRQVVGMETLVRWNHPEDGLIPPDDFLPMVKELGLMGALDLWSMTAALTEKRRLNDVGFGHLGIAFNASPELLAHPEFIDRLIWGVEAANIDRAQVTIEVLENTNFGEVMETASHASIIKDLRLAGFQVHLDDFGIGFAGLSHLASIEVSGVKIDRGLISVLLEDGTSRKIVRKIIELANDLGLTVIAEGVEDLHTANTLQAMGCGVIQGYWLSRPLPLDQLHDWLNEQANSEDSLRA